MLFEISFELFYFNRNVMGPLHTPIALAYRPLHRFFSIFPFSYVVLSSIFYTLLIVCECVFDRPVAVACIKVKLTSLADRSFTVAGPRVRNNLPLYM